MSSVRALVAGHGEFSAGLISAVEQISGLGSTLAGFTNGGLSALTVEAGMRQMLDVHNISVIFTDLPAGSCTLAARRLQRLRPEVVVVVGANLPSLLEFVFSARADGAAARVAGDKGRAALQVLGTGSPT